MPSTSLQSKITISSAGSRKTTLLVNKALNCKKKTLITTYTIENLAQIKDYCLNKVKIIPDNKIIETWYTFLLRECVRPYQNMVFPNLRVKSIDFDSIRPIGISKSKRGYFINKSNNIYKDYISDFVCLANEKTNGLVVQRLENIYKNIYIDEVQDLASWDLNFVEMLLKSKIELFMVGDPRQATYKTSNSSKNNAKSGINLDKWVNELVDKNLVERIDRVECFRSNQAICDVADSLYPNFPITKSKFEEKTSHDGVFVIHPNNVDEYVGKYKPQCLRWSKVIDDKLDSINMGQSKGKTFPRVLIFPTTDMENFLKDPQAYTLKPITRAKLYVALTRGRFSITIEFKNDVLLDCEYMSISEFKNKLPKQLKLL